MGRQPLPAQTRSVIFGGNPEVAGPTIQTDTMRAMTVAAAAAAAVATAP
jgi:hypothetical protein